VKKAKMRISLALIFLVLSQNSYSEQWEWYTKIGSLKSYAKSNVICFNAERVEKMLCFNKDDVGGDVKFSIILSAKMSKATVNLSYLIPKEEEMAVWYDHSKFYKLHHIYIN